MRLNPIVEESLDLIFRTRQFRLLHVVYLGSLTAATLALWPVRGFMEFFSSQTVPGAFLALAVFQLVGISGISLYLGMDRLAGSRIIRYSEWLERTSVPVRTIVTGKVASAFGHTLFLVAIGSPFLYIAAGPAGIPVRAVLSVQWLTALVALFCRAAGMFICMAGERRDFVRIIGSWFFLALLYLATIQLAPRFNPIIAVTSQQNEGSPLVSTVGPVPFISHPALIPSIYFIAGMVIAIAALVLAMRRTRVRAADRTLHG